MAQAVGMSLNGDAVGLVAHADRGRGHALRRFVRRNPVGAAAGVVCVLLILLAVLAPAIAPHPADEVGFPRLRPPSAEYPFGTDNLFRDMYSRIILAIGNAILVEASLSFLGLGVSSAAHPSWGRMLQETRQFWQVAWWTAVIPGAAISLAVLAFNLFGDALRDALDPRLRGS
jgi:ABC-type dipeptide/oligopeptide/nickel transport system permease subunit